VRPLPISQPSPDPRGPEVGKGFGRHVGVAHQLVGLAIQGLASHFCAGSKPSRTGQTQLPDNADTEALSQAMEHLVCEVAFWRMAL